jgi:uncharacterized protein
MDLSEPEIRVLGCLLEKQRTTPDQYPLSLNALRLACNQATNRDPVVDYDEAVIRDALHRLERRGFTRLASGRGSRAIKHHHLLTEALPMSDAEQGVMCVLMLRGPQTPGELKQRSDRLHSFAGLEEVHSTLSALIERRLVARLGRRPGQKEERYEQLLGADADPAHPNGTLARVPAYPAAPRPTPPIVAEAPSELGASAALDEQGGQLSALEERVERLERELAELRAAVLERVP